MTISTPTKQSGSVTFGGGSVAVPIAALDTSKSEIIITYSNDNNSQDQRVFAVPFFPTLGASITSFTIQRDASGSGNETVNWEIRIHGAGVTVQHFNGNHGTGGPTTSVALSTIKLDKTYARYYSEVSINALDELEVSRAKITTTTNCDIITGFTPRSGRFYSLQIVEMDDSAVTVQQVETTWVAETALNSTAFTAVDQTKSFVVSAGMSLTDALGFYANWGMLAIMLDSTKIQMRRDSGVGTGGGVSMHYVVEIDQDGVLVQSETAIGVSSGTATGVSTFGSAVVVAETFIEPASHFGMSESADTNTGKAAFRQSINTTTNTLTRGITTTSSVVVASQVVTIGSAVPPTDDDGRIYPLAVDRIYDKIIPSLYG